MLAELEAQIAASKEDPRTVAYFRELQKHEALS